MDSSHLQGGGGMTEARSYERSITVDLPYADAVTRTRRALPSRASAS